MAGGLENESERGAGCPQHGSGDPGARCAAPDCRGVHADHLRRSLLLDVVEASCRRLLRSSADGRGGDPARHADRRRYRVRRKAGLDPAGAADELGDLSGCRDPVRQPARGRLVGDPSEHHADGCGRHHDRHAGRAASGGFQSAAVCARQGAADRPRRVVAGGRRRRRLRAAVEIHRAVLRTGDPDLAGRRSQAAALADLALALSRRARRAGSVCAGHSLERRAPLGFLHQADGAGEDRGFPPGLHRRADPDADRVRDAAGVDARRDGAVRALPASRRRAAGARARQYDVLGHRRLFRLALAACPRRGQLVCAGLSGVCDRRRRRRASGRMGAASAARWSISAGAGRCRAAS